MAQKFLRMLAGVIAELEALVTSAGAGDAGKIPALDATGKLDNSLMPVGIGADSKILPASENLAAGDLVNVWNDSGTAKARKADATVAGKEANGFVLAAVTSGDERHGLFRRHGHAAFRPDPGSGLLSRHHRRRDHDHAAFRIRQRGSTSGQGFVGDRADLRARRAGYFGVRIWLKKS